MTQTIQTLEYKTRLDPSTLNRVAEILKTIAHPARLAVIELLENGEEYSVASLMEKTGVEQSLLSHHLSKMKDRGILKSRRDGKNIYYSLMDNNLTRIFECLQCCSLLIK